MPLKNPTHIPGLGFRDTISAQVLDERSQPESLDRSANPSHVPNVSQSRQNSRPSYGVDTLNPLGAKDVDDKKKRALALKMPATNETVPYHTGNATGSASNEERFRPKLDSRSSKAKKANTIPPRALAFEDTATIVFDDEYFTQNNENHTVVYRGNPENSTRLPLQPSGVIQRFPNTFDDTESFEGIAIPEDFGDVALKAERQLQQQQEHDRTNTTHRLLGADQLDMSIDRATQDVADTPSRVSNPQQTVARNMTASKTVTFDSPAPRRTSSARADSPELELPRYRKASTMFPRTSPLEPKDDSSSFAQSLPAETLTQNTRKASLLSQHQVNQVAKRPSNNTFESSRASDYPTSSDDDIPSVQSRPASPDGTAPMEQNPLKRHREEQIDYDLQTLKSMKFDDLHEEVFDQESQEYQRQPVFDGHAGQTTLAQRLNNLGKMSEEEQKAMFRSQNDEEWVHVGSWFIERFQEDLKRLLEARLERRKTSMKFESEIRKRQKEIDWCMNGVEDELKELREGGGELIKGRDAPSKRGTPQKK